MIDLYKQDTCRASSSVLQLQLLPSDRTADWSGHRDIRTGTRKTICYRCLQWERETGSPHRLCQSARSRVPLGSSCRGFRSRLFKASETTFALPILTHTFLRAGRVPALLPFSSRLFRRTHHTTKQARRWCALNINKAYIRAYHPRCDLCTPCSPSIPFSLVPPSQSTHPYLLQSDNPDEDESNEVLVACPTVVSSDSSGFAEAERESLVVATCAALAHPTTVARHTSATGYLEKDGAVYSPLALHGASDRDTVDPLGKMTPSTSDVCVADPWHLVGQPPTTFIDSTHCMVDGDGAASAAGITSASSETVLQASNTASAESSAADALVNCEITERCWPGDTEDVVRTSSVHGDSESRVSEQDPPPVALDDDQSPLNVTERGVQALTGAGELVAGLIAATVTLGRPASPDTISVVMPEDDGCVQVTSSEENSPQLVDVLRQSALHDRYRDSDLRSRPFSLEPATVYDSDMVDVLSDSLDLDDSWVTVGSPPDGTASLTDLDQNRNSLEAARGFFRRHLQRLRPSAGSL